MTMRITPDRISTLAKDEVFVFGSNEAGRHGAGAARDALAFGAKFGVYLGMCGQTFAIPTKDPRLRTLPLDRIQSYVNTFLGYAKLAPHLKFMVTPIGCGLAGYKPSQISPFFKEGVQLENVWLPSSFHDFYRQEKKD